MSALKDKIVQDLTSSMKARDKERTGVLRMVKAALLYETRQGSKHELSDAEVVKVLTREVKKRKESATIYAEAGRQELADAELFEAQVMSEYLPQQLDDAAVVEVVDKCAAGLEAELGEPLTMKNMGQLMKLVQAEAAGQADGKRLSEAVRARLQG